MVHQVNQEVPGVVVAHPIATAGRKRDLGAFVPGGEEPLPGQPQPAAAAGGIGPPLAGQDHVVQHRAAVHGRPGAVPVDQVSFYLSDVAATKIYTLSLHDATPSEQ